MQQLYIYANTYERINHCGEREGGGARERERGWGVHCQEKEEVFNDNIITEHQCTKENDGRETERHRERERERERERDRERERETETERQRGVDEVTGTY